MNDNRNRPRRRSIRLKDFDYSRQGCYFVTVCVQKRLCLFGTIKDYAFQPNSAGTLIAEEWLNLPTRFEWIELDFFIVMPNHFHGILVFTEGNEFKKTLGEVIGAWKSKTTVEYIQGVQHYQWKRFSGTLWQRGYHDHIVRDQKELERLRNYIYHNPAQWEIDQLHPNNPSKW